MKAMIVNDLAAFDVKSCSPDTDLATAAKIIWDCDCGVVPVVNASIKQRARVAIV
jgi:hypothetical protein